MVEESPISIDPASLLAPHFDSLDSMFNFQPGQAINVQAKVLKVDEANMVKIWKKQDVTITDGMVLTLLVSNLCTAFRA